MLQGPGGQPFRTKGLITWPQQNESLNNQCIWKKPQASDETTALANTLNLA